MSMRIAASALLAVFLSAAAAHAEDRWPTKKWPTATPKEVGLDPAALAAFDADLAAGKYGYIDTITVIRGGKVAFDKSYKHNYDAIYGKLAKDGFPISVHDRSGPYNYYATWWHPWYRRGDLHTLQSVTKVIVSTVVGVAVTRKDFPDLDTPVMTFFDEKKVANLDDRKRRMTIRHLLTMTSGVQWDDPLPLAQAGPDTDTRFEASYDWVKFTIDLPMANEPGKVYTYASGNVQLLVHIFNRAVGRDIEDYAAELLFAPLGIEKHFWKRTPAGHADGSGGLYLRPHDFAKIGYLHLRKGEWDGKRILSREWVAESTKGHSDARKKLPGLKWGYAWAVLPYGANDRFTMYGNSGFGDQGVMVFPAHDAMMVYTGWNTLDDSKHLSPPAAIEQMIRIATDGRSGK